MREKAQNESWCETSLLDRKKPNTWLCSQRKANYCVEISLQEKQEAKRCSDGAHAF
jgi:hypothetical protein